MKRTIRKAVEGDIEFIFSTWLRSYRHDSPLTRLIHSDTFFHGHQKLVEKLLVRPKVRVHVCCDEADPNHIFGWSATEENTLHFIYVKKPLRREGVGSELLAFSGLPEKIKGCEISHLTNTAWSLLKENKWEAEFNPYLLFPWEGENECPK